MSNFDWRAGGFVKVTIDGTATVRSFTHEAQALQHASALEDLNYQGHVGAVITVFPEEQWHTQMEGNRDGR